MIEGHCLCGAVTVRITGPHEEAVGACHCRMCQRWSGGLFLSFDADEDSVEFSGPVTRHASSAIAERAFCSVCGSHLWMRDTNGAGYDLMPGLFAAAKGWPLRSEIYVDQAMASVVLRGDHPRHSAAAYEATHPHVEGDRP